MLILNESDYMYLKHEGFILIDDNWSFPDEQYIITKCIQNDENKLFLEHLKKCDSFVEKHKITIQEFKNKLLTDLNEKV